MPRSLTSRQRIIRQIRGQEVDRIPTLGGWINGVSNLAELAGISVEAYLADLVAGVVRANKTLDVDGMIMPVVPRRRDEIRTGSVEETAFAGVRVIHHCDGDVRSLIDDFLATGFSGFQGFQYECGMDLHDLKRRRSALGEPILLFTGLSVTRTLPFGNHENICQEVDYFLDATDGGKGMFLFTSNVAGVEVPPANLLAAYRYVRQWNPAQARTITHRAWPWQCRYGQEIPVNLN